MKSLHENLCPQGNLVGLIDFFFPFRGLIDKKIVQY